MLIIDLFFKKRNQASKWFVKGNPTCPYRSLALKPAYTMNTI